MGRRSRSRSRSPGGSRKEKRKRKDRDGKDRDGKDRDGDRGGRRDADRDRRRHVDEPSNGHADAPSPEATYIDDELSTRLEEPQYNYNQEPESSRQYSPPPPSRESRRDSPPRRRRSRSPDVEVSGYVQSAPNSYARYGQGADWNTAIPIEDDSDDDDIDGVELLTTAPPVNEELEMAKIMGFSGFQTTKNKQVQGNDIYVANIQKKRRYRQYMNRRGGFNRPLDCLQ